MTLPIQLVTVESRRKKPARQRAFFMVALLLAALLLLALSGCADAGAQETNPTPQEQRIARAADRACEGLTPVWQDDGSHICLKERP